MDEGLLLSLSILLGFFQFLVFFFFFFFIFLFLLILGRYFLASILHVLNVFLASDFTSEFGFWKKRKCEWYFLKIDFKT